MTKKKILIVDDEEAFTKVVKLNLDSTGKYEVKTENMGSRAIEAARSFKPDLIFLDIVMPDTEGSEVALQLKSDRDFKNTPIVFLTATVTPDEAGSSGRIIGGQTFLAKPVSTQQMVDCIEKYARK
jgi:CheY-like chemotaxis protein